VGDQEANGSCPGGGLIPFGCEQGEHGFEVMHKTLGEANCGCVPEDALVVNGTIIECVLNLEIYMAPSKGQYITATVQQAECLGNQATGYKTVCLEGQCVDRVGYIYPMAR